MLEGGTSEACSLVIEQEESEGKKLKCCVCGIYPHKTHRGGRYITESYYCRRHAELVNGARTRLANLWVTLQDRATNTEATPA